MQSLMVPLWTMAFLSEKVIGLKHMHDNMDEFLLGLHSVPLFQFYHTDMQVESHQLDFGKLRSKPCQKLSQLKIKLIKM